MTPRRALLVLALLAAPALLAAGCGDPAPEHAPPAPVDGPRLGPYPLAQFYLEHDRFLSVTDPRTVHADDATWLQPGDEVFGIVVGGEPRAYPVAMLAYHHVVNDVVQGIPVAVTY